mmetsp:Transcript_30044/g.48543  ORF Transcript_30044/g.48543 Transcript_30044/m.48543 type:complete len:100 (-) Transcript_30044:104-403(-)
MGLEFLRIFCYDQYGRPIAGYVNIGPNMMSLDPRKWEEQVNVCIHEIMHALGFTARSYAKYRDWETGEVRGYDNVIREVMIPAYPYPIKALVSPQVGTV